MSSGYIQSSDYNESKPNLLLSTVVISAACLFFLYEFIIQVSPSVMVSDLMRDYHVDAAGLGAISAFYYYAYTPMQIPAGLLYDRFGARILLTIACTICALGAFAFALTDSAILASAGRFFMGCGSAFAFIGCLVLVSRWCPPQYFALLAGIIQMMSSVGAIAGQVPLAAAVAAYGWRHSMMFISIAGFVLALIIWLVIRDSPAFKKQQKMQHLQKGELKRLWKVSKRLQTWLVAVYAFTSWAPILVFAALWGVPYLMRLYGISATEASSMVAMVWIAIAVGSPLMGWFSDKIGRRNLPLAICSAVGLVASLLFLYIPSIPQPVMYVLLFFFGFGASAQTLSFAVVRDNNPPHTVGTAIGLNNMMVVAGGAIFQPVVGVLLHLNWNGQMSNGVPVYAASDFRIGLSVIPICFFVGLIFSLKFLRESYCRPQYK